MVKRYKSFKICTKKFGAVLVVGGVLVAQDFIMEYSVMGPRTRIFTEERMAEFKGIHQMRLGEDTPTPIMGYPDMGAGYYSKRIPYKDWYEFNCAQRVHGNSLEHLSWSLPLLMVAGVFQPTLAAGLGGVVVAGRALY